MGVRTTFLTKKQTKVSEYRNQEPGKRVTTEYWNDGKDSSLDNTSRILNSQCKILNELRKEGSRFKAQG
jgi:hypothetical protein